MKYFLILLLSILSLSVLEAASGKVILNNGKTLRGDVCKNSDGSCNVALTNGVVRFEKCEIKRVIIYSTRDRASENFATALSITPGEKPASLKSISTPYDDLIHTSARKHKVDPALVKAVMRAESNFNSKDVSHKGASGLMQLMPKTAKMMGVKNIFSPTENINAGTLYLSYMLEEFNGDIEKALAAYNAGPGAVKKYKDIPPYQETRRYIKTVYGYYLYYKNHADNKMQAYVDDKGCLYIGN